jgi:flagellar basal-body rod protein FlgG
MFNILQNESYNTLRHDMENLSDNVHNVQNALTDGYKAKKTTFHETVNGLKTYETHDFSSGVAKKTYRELDFAIQGEGFFEVIMPDNTVAYTRSGSFKLSPDGELLAPQGYPISTTASEQDLSNADTNQFSLSLSNSAIKIPTGVPVTLNDKGELFDPANDKLGKINLVTFTNLDGLRDLGNGLYVPTKDAGQTKDIKIGYMRGETQLLQGYVEGSNAQLMEGMSKILELNTAIKAEMKIFKTLDQMHGDLNSTISRNL